MPFVFGDCELDDTVRQLRRSVVVVPLSLKAFQLLETLLDERPNALSKERLLDLLWPDSFVSDASLHNLVAELRAAIGDAPRRSVFIRTLHRYGYAFHGPVHEVDAQRTRRHEGGSLFWNAQELPLAEGENRIGRSADCQMCLASSTLSRHHARIVVEHGHATLADLGSKN